MPVITRMMNIHLKPFKKISGYLKEDGKLLIAIENKFGLKYWAGSREDHTGKFFDGLEGYIDTDSKVRTFSKEALKKIITDAGYGRAEFYYPFPDYKFPVQIFLMSTFHEKMILI